MTGKGTQHDIHALKYGTYFDYTTLTTLACVARGRGLVQYGSKKDGSENPMPMYEFICKECKKVFKVALSLAEYQKGRVSCPKCQSKRVEQRMAAFFAVTSKKS
jgi:putative FmdB family regulatory protein